MDISIIIVNYNTRELLSACLRSLLADSYPFQFEVLVVDNGSIDGSVEIVKSEYPTVHLILNARNEGFAKPNNDGIKVAKGQCVFLLNSDTQVAPGALSTLKRFLDDFPEAGACGPMLVYPDGQIQHSVRGFATLWTHFCDMLFLDRLFPRSRLFGQGEMGYFRYDSTDEVDHLMAAAFLVRKRVIDQVGLFDERLSIYYNDMDWCYRIKQAGWKLFYVHTARVVHHHGKTIAQVNKDFEYHREMHKNIMLYYQKHYGRCSLVLYKLLLILGFTVRSFGWTAYRLLRPTEQALLMCRFSWKTLALALPFWTPAQKER